jgi:hypothetical protein
MEQNSKLGYLPVIADAAVKKFWEITSWMTIKSTG